MSDPSLETLTFLFTDIEGSTRLLSQLGDDYGRLLEEHFVALREAVGSQGGREIGQEGDALFCGFPSAAGAVAAALAAQRSLLGHHWPEGAEIRVRMGLHTGEAMLTPEGYVGLDVHRVARITDAGHGGQVLCSRTTRDLVRDSLPEGVELMELGEFRLKDLSRPEQLFQLVAPGFPGDFPPLRSLEIPTNLPTQLTSFVGRERELAEAQELLSHTRLLTLTGPGGTGKTRLSLALAARVAEQFPDGVFFVPLASIFDPRLVPSAVVASLGFQEAAGASPKDRLLEHLRERNLLLVLDNFEQVLEAAPLVTELLQAAPRLELVVTSRAALRVYGEQEYPVPVLGVPDLSHLPPLESLSSFEAVALFIERARAVRPGFTVTNETAPAVAEITARLDGLPLAIELAAARVKLLPPQAIVARLGDRLSLLQGGSRDLPRRQQTLRDAIAWSHDLLDEGGRRLLARLSVFRGGCSLDQAEAVCGPTEEGREVLDGLEALASHSLLRHEEVGGEPRFSMLETIREFASEQLAESGEEPEIRARHAQAYLELAEQAAPHLTGKDQGLWLDHLEREHDNLRSALYCAIERPDPATAFRLAASSWRFWQMRGHLHEGRARVEVVLALPAPPELDSERAGALEAAGGLAYWQGDFDAAGNWYGEAVEIQRRSGNDSGLANALYNLAFPSGLLEAKPESRLLLEEALSIYRGLGDEAGIANVLFGFGDYSFFEADYLRARSYLEEALSISRRLEDVFETGWGVYLLGFVAMREGSLQEAHDHWSESLPMFAEAGDVSGVVLHLDRFAELARAQGALERSVRLAGAVSSLGSTSGTDLHRMVSEFEGRDSSAAPGLSEAEAAAAWEEGQVMTLQEAVAYALQE